MGNAEKAQERAIRNTSEINSYTDSD